MKGCSKNCKSSIKRIFLVIIWSEVVWNLSCICCKIFWICEQKRKTQLQSPRVKYKRVEKLIQNIRNYSYWKNSDLHKNRHYFDYKNTSPQQNLAQKSTSMPGVKRCVLTPLHSSKFPIMFCFCRSRKLIKISYWNLLRILFNEWGKFPKNHWLFISYKIKTFVLAFQSKICIFFLSALIHQISMKGRIQTVLLTVNIISNR